MSDPVISLPEEIRTETAISEWTNNRHMRGFAWFWYITAIDGTPPTMTFVIEIEEQFSKEPFTLWQSNMTQNSIGDYTYQHVAGQGVGMPVFTSTRDHDVPHGPWRVKIIHSNDTPVTYTVSYCPYR